MRTLENKLLFFTLFFTACILSACGGESEEEEKSAIDQFTHETASKAVHYIQDPINKAQVVQDLSNQHAEDIKQAMEETNQ